MQVILPPGVGFHDLFDHVGNNDMTCRISPIGISSCSVIGKVLRYYALL